MRLAWLITTADAQLGRGAEGRLLWKRYSKYSSVGIKGTSGHARNCNYCRMSSVGKMTGHAHATKKQWHPAQVITKRLAEEPTDNAHHRLHCRQQQLYLLASGQEVVGEPVQCETRGHVE